MDYMHCAVLPMIGSVSFKHRQKEPQTDATVGKKINKYGLLGQTELVMCENVGEIA